MVWSNYFVARATFRVTRLAAEVCGVGVLLAEDEKPFFLECLQFDSLMLLEILRNSGVYDVCEVMLEMM